MSLVKQKYNFIFAKNSLKLYFYVTVSMLMNEIDEDYDEEDLDLGTEITDSPPWYCEPELEDIEDTSEDTALLRVKPNLEIIVTPISPVRRTQNGVRIFFSIIIDYISVISI